jgi:hypothetical protein
MATTTLEDRLRTLIEEGQAIRGVNDGRGHGHPVFKAWRMRAQAALDDKLGADSRIPREFAKLRFRYRRSAWTDGMPPVTAEQHKAQFSNALNDALALLVAAVEAEPRSPEASSPPLVHIEQVGNTTTATATAAAEVHVAVTVQQLRQLVANEPGLTPEERADAIASLPDDPDELTIDKVDKLLGVATKAKGLFSPLLAWLVAHADRIEWPG